MILTTLVPQYSSVSMEEEFHHVQRWSDGISFKLTSLKQKTFRRPSARYFSAPQPLPFIEQVTLTKLLGIYIFPNFFCCCTCRARSVSC